MNSRRRFRPDWLMLAAVAALLLLSCLFIYSADYRNDHAAGGLVLRQLVWIVTGAGCYTAAAVFDYRKLTLFHGWVYLGGVLALLLVLFFGLSICGARRWFSIGGLTVQPSEFAKLTTLFTLAARLSSPSTDVERFKTFIVAFVLAAIPFLLIAAEPDLGSAMVLVPLVFVLLFCAGAPAKPLMLIVGTGLAALFVLVVWLRFFPESCPVFTDYQKNRILVYLNVNEDPLGAGWNKLQSQIAVGSGGFYGKGYLKGTQNILGFLPRTVAPTDFIFSVVAEETGFAGCSVLLALYSVVTACCLRAAIAARDLFGRLIAAGAGVLIFSHVFVNIAMTIGLMPITGLPLPLMSYGGSFMVSTMTALGLVQSVYLRRRI